MIHSCVMVSVASVSPISISFLATRQDSTDRESATTLELLLITFALLISGVLTVISKRKKPVRIEPRHPAFSHTIIVIAVLFTVGVASLAVATLFLGWLQVISLSAVAAIVFALGPAFIYLPLEILTYKRETVNSHLMWNNPSLKIRKSKFRYIRFIPDENENENEQEGQPGSQALRNKKELPETRWPVPDIRPSSKTVDNSRFMIIRFMPSKHDCASRLKLCIMAPCHKAKDVEDSTASGHIEAEDKENSTAIGCCCWKPTSDAKPTTERSKWHHIYGKHVATYHNFSHIQDNDHGITSWWWSGVSSATHLVANPDILHLESKRRVINALALLSDIISIGDLVLYFHQNCFYWMLRKDRYVRTAVTSAPGFTCNRILKELDMEDWGSIGTEMLSSGFELPYSKWYPIMFLILAEKSQRFYFPKTKKGIGCQKVCNKLREVRWKSIREKASEWMKKWPRGESHSEKISSGQEVPDTGDSHSISSGQEVLDRLWEVRGEQEGFIDNANKWVDAWLKGWGLDIDKVKRSMLRMPVDEATVNSGASSYYMNVNV